ncbi:etoposide-induced protein 2.4-domain-containing protein [Mycena floridula]|nr:etoposide-induced protein 2.4-domain-containing protein [Mycena floridula]
MSKRSYPAFLSVSQSLLLQAQWAWHGLVDACRWNLVLSTVLGDPEIRANVLKSLLLNSLSLASIYTFDILLLPLVKQKEQQNWLHRNIGWFYQLLWIFPVVGVSYYLNSTWCMTIAKRTHLLQHGSHGIASPQPVTYTGMLKSIATSAYRVVMVFTSVAISLALANVPVPYVGPFVGFLFVCWIDSYYLFEFVWVARGMSLSRRIRHLEERWAYYLAFGFPSSVLCNWGSPLANAAIFALVYPLFIIMALHAKPVPFDPYSPANSENDVVRHPSPFVPIRLPIFALVMWLNDWIVRFLSVGGKSRGGPMRRGISYSDLAESIEDGKEQRFEQPRVTSQTVPGRINIGRRKMD